MAIFNPQYFTNPLASLNTAFGIPTCILNFAVEALGLIDSSVLSTLAKAAQDGRTTARSAIAGLVNSLFFDMGLLQYDAVTGKLTLFSESSKYGIDLGFLETLANVTGQLAAIEDFVNQGIELYQEISQCLEEMENWLNSTGPAPLTGYGGIGGGSTDQYTDAYRTAKLAICRQQVQEATDFINSCDKLIENIGTVLFQRQQAIDLTSDEDDPIFRLIFGPPVSTQGLFVLSEDGLYYDSQTRLYNGEPIPSASDIGFIIDSDKWMLEHAANLGGKGTVISVDDLNRYVDTIFDPNIINDSYYLATYYDADHFIGVLLGQKTKRVENISAEIEELLSAGNSEESALVVNHRQNLYSVIDSFNDKINRRKKQIEVAVEAPLLFGSNKYFAPGEVPVNDFSFLSSISLSVALEKQEQLVFESGDVEDVVLPIKPIYVTDYGTTSKVTLTPLVVPPIGKGSIVFSPSVSSTIVPALSLTDSIQDDRLFSIYNFLKPDTTTPDSSLFQTLNCATLDTYGNAQLVGSPGSVFSSGVGIPFLGGIAKFNQNDYLLTKTNNFLRLPPIEELQNLFYSSKGCSIDCWLHLPNYGSDGTLKETTGSGFRPYAGGAWGDYNYYKILLANENTGGDPGVEDVSSLVDVNGSNVTKGLLIGFTRDPVVYSDDFIIPGPNTDPGLNADIDSSSTVASSCFFVAPVMSFGSSVEFIPNTDCANSEDLKYNKFVVRDDLEVNGKKFTDVSGNFVHIHVSFDVSSDICSVYLDGVQMATSSITSVFGNEPRVAPRIPTFISPADSATSSFYYSSGTVNHREPWSTFQYGPRTDTYFTPWIVGGGWTDGYPIDSTSIEGGFMGIRHGLTSGLNGFVGSLKFYSKPLTNKEVLQNFNAQQGFFKNIQT